MSCYEVMFIFPLLCSSFVNRPIRHNIKHKIPQLKYMTDKDLSNTFLKYEGICTFSTVKASYISPSG